MRMLTPSQWAFWQYSCILCIWLHSSNVSRKDNIALWMLAAVTSQRRRSENKTSNDYGLEKHYESNCRYTEVASDQNRTCLHATRKG